MSNKNNISLFETGSGGDFEFKNGDIQMTGALWTMVYVALFGGNPGNLSTTQKLDNEFRNDYWANNLLFPNNPEKQINSKFEYTLKTNALTSSNLILFERVALDDLKYLSYLGKFTVSCEIASVDTLKTIISVDKIDGTNDVAEIIWSETANDVIYESGDAILKNRVEYGYLYNAYAYQDANFAPTGWRLPVLADFTELATFAGGSSVLGNKLKESGTDYWNTDNGTNDYDFDARGTGYRYYTDGVFDFIKEFTFYPCIDGITLRHLQIRDTGASTLILSSNGGEGFPVRLIKDVPDNTPFIYDFEGNKYNTVKIGNQLWTSENWASNYLIDGTLIPTITDNANWVNAGTANTSAKCAYDNDINNAIITI